MPLVDKIERLKEDDSERTMFSATTVNELIDILNALRKMEVVGGQVIWSDSNVKLIVSGSGGTGGGGDVTNNNTYNSSSIYCLNVWS
jgi:hypothetical protein